MSKRQPDYEKQLKVIADILNKLPKSSQTDLNGALASFFSKVNSDTISTTGNPAKLKPLEATIIEALGGTICYFSVWHPPVKECDIPRACQNSDCSDCRCKDNKKAKDPCYGWKK